MTGLELLVYDRIFLEFFNGFQKGVGGVGRLWVAGLPGCGVESRALHKLNRVLGYVILSTCDGTLR